MGCFKRGPSKVNPHLKQPIFQEDFMLKNFKTFQLSVQFYHQCQALHLKHHLKDQWVRASSSVVLNVAEGNAKASLKDKKKFFNIAYASLKECEAILYLSQKPPQALLLHADHIGGCLYKLMH